MRGFAQDGMELRRPVLYGVGGRHGEHLDRGCEDCTGWEGLRLGDGAWRFREWASLMRRARTDQVDKDMKVRLAMRESR